MWTGVIFEVFWKTFRVTFTEMWRNWREIWEELWQYTKVVQKLVLIIFGWTSNSIYRNSNEAHVFCSAHRCIRTKVITKSKVAHLWCNPQNMTSLVCHSTECTHTQYAPVCYRDAQPIWSRHVLCPYVTWLSQKIYRDIM